MGWGFLSDIGDKLKSGGWEAKLKEMIPSYGQSLIDDAELCKKVRAETATVLNLTQQP